MVSPIWFSSFLPYLWNNNLLPTLASNLPKKWNHESLIWRSTKGQCPQPVSVPPNQRHPLLFSPTLHHSATDELCGRSAADITSCDVVPLYPGGTSSTVQLRIAYFTNARRYLTALLRCLSWPPLAALCPCDSSKPHNWTARTSLQSHSTLNFIYMYISTHGRDTLFRAITCQTAVERIGMSVFSRISLLNC